MWGTTRFCVSAPSACFGNAKACSKHTTEEIVTCLDNGFNEGHGLDKSIMIHSFKRRFGSSVDQLDREVGKT